MTRATIIVTVDQPPKPGFVAYKPEHVVHEIEALDFPGAQITAVQAQTPNEAKWVAGTEVHVVDHPSVLNDLNAYVLDDGGQEVWIVIAHGSHNDKKHTIVPNGSRHVLPRKHLADGLVS